MKFTTNTTHSDMFRRAFPEDQPSGETITSMYTAVFEKYIKQCEADLHDSLVSEKFDPERISLDTLLGEPPAPHPHLWHLRRLQKLKAVLENVQLEGSWE